jgi:3-hydroxyisobutyrate dehydrogenase-like beta-hydroxyacid dehydrogenase
LINHIGFIGFGEAGWNFAAGLRGVSPELRITAYDIRFPSEPGMRERADALGVKAVDAVDASIAGPDMILSFVVAKASVEVAEASAAVMHAGQFYVDCNSTSPQMKQRVETVFASSPVRMIDSAVMSGLPGNRHEVPMNLSGPGADEAAWALNALGCVTEAMGEQVGAASALKMMRSVMMKGIDALLLECIEGARHYGAAETALASMADAYPGIDWVARAPRSLSRASEHAVRRASEMREVAETLRAVGVEPMMAEATSRRIAMAQPLIKENGGAAFGSLDELMAAMDKVGND